MPNVFKVSPNVPKNSVIPNVLKLSNSSKNSGLMSGLLSGLGEGLGILEKSGPYNQVESEGMLGKEYSIPTVNPVDQSYMPKCAQGRCVRPRKITNSDGTTREECDKYGEPRQIPESDMFDSKERHSCGYDSNPVEMFSNAKPTYSVYWKPGTKPKAGGTRRNNIKNVRKTRRNKHKN
jgi:hypothetical protein